MKSKILYKNFLGEYNILVTKTVSGKRSDTYATLRVIYDTHLWIDDNIVAKNRIPSSTMIVGSVIDTSTLISLLTSTIQTK